MGKAEKLGVVTLSGPHDGSYGVPNEPGRDGLGSEPAAVLRQNRVPGHDSRIGYTFTPGRSALVDDREAEPRSQSKGSETLPQVGLDGSDAVVSLAPPIVLADSCCEPKTPSSFSESLSIAPRPPAAGSWRQIQRFALAGKSADGPYRN